ncbi:flagellar hook assembly protein FlgD [Alteromonadaceae bacterium BrNp21-10]|nr:flagellar hook assembly protein FlgD [Alteromonadaceae bacterium BrNp21-10]
MDGIKNTGLGLDYYWQEEEVATENKNGQLTQEDFFSLLTEQLSNQDPTKPVDNDQMIAQMTSFTMADSLSQLNTKFDTFATSMNSGQALQASSLIGQNVLVSGDSATLAADANVTGVIINQKAAHEMKITIESANGETVKVIPVGSQSAGNIEFTWDGTDANGNLMPPGNYAIKVQATVGGEVKDLPTAFNRHVNSVSLTGSSQGIILNLKGDQSVLLSNVLEIGGNA